MATAQGPKESGISIRVVVIKDGDCYFAQCLEVDIAAQGSSKDDAMMRLKAVFSSEVAAAKEAGKNLMDIGPAPGAFHAIFASDKIEREQLVA